MAISSAHPHPLAFPVGILGNIISVMVYLAPMPTFYRIYKKKSTEGFQSIPYLVALFSSMMWIYYAFLKSDAFLLITINSIGCFIESFYITIFIIYAPKQARILTAKILVLLNFGSFCLIYLLTFFLVKGSNRVQVLGWICVVFSACVFAAPLSIVRLVIRTKSVEFMPFSLSFFLTMSAILWFSYGLLLEDIFIAIPNILGFLFGVVQMLLYVIYKNMKKVVEEEKFDHQHHQNGITTSTTTTTTSSIDHHHVIRLSSMGSAEVHPIDLQLIVLDHINTITMGHHHDGDDDDDDLDRQNMHQQVTTADDDHQIGGGVGEMQNEAGDPISGGEKYSDLNLVVQV